MWLPGARTARLAATLAAFLAAAGAAQAACRSDVFEDHRYTVCSFDPAASDIRMFWQDGEGVPYRTFPALADDLTNRGLMLAFGMNGGMYDTDLAPIGLYVEDGREIVAANTRTVTKRPVPNFYKSPNGVFFISGDSAGVVETGAYVKRKIPADFATQSGPLLVIGGKIHPAFIPDSSDRNRRDGVGISGDGAVHFVISEDAINFDTFARFFRDGLGCDDALFLDGGSAPGLFSRELKRADWPGHGGFGPIIAVVEPAAAPATE